MTKIKRAYEEEEEKTASEEGSETGTKTACGEGSKKKRERIPYKEEAIEVRKKKIAC